MDPVTWMSTENIGFIIQETYYFKYVCHLKSYSYHTTDIREENFNKVNLLKQILYSKVGKKTKLFKRRKEDKTNERQETDKDKSYKGFCDCCPARFCK